MNAIIGSVGTFAIAAFLTIALILGPKGAGKAKPLGWWAAFTIGLFAGATYKAAGSPFDLIGIGVYDLIDTARQVHPDLTVPGIALIITALLAWKRMSVRSAGLWGVVLMYVASNAGGAWGIAAAEIQLLVQRLST